MADTSDQNRNLLFAAYKKLPSLEQLLMQLLSVIYEPTSRTTIVKCMLKAGIKGPDSLPSLAPHLKKLNRLGLLDGQYRCHDAIIEMLSRIALQDGRFMAMAVAIQEEQPLAAHLGNRSRRYLRIMREIRIGLYSNDISYVENLLALLPYENDMSGQDAPVVRTCTNPFQPQWFQTLPASQQFYLLVRIISHSQAHLVFFPDVCEYLSRTVQASLTDEERLPFLRLWAGYLLWLGKPLEVRDLLLAAPEFFIGSGLQGGVDFLLGNNDQAIDSFEMDLERLRKISGRDAAYFFADSGLFYVFALFKENVSENFFRIRAIILLAKDCKLTEMLKNLYRVLEVVLLSQEGRVVEADILLDHLLQEPHGIVQIFSSLCRYWIDGKMPSGYEGDETRARLELLYERAWSNGYNWLAVQIGSLLLKLTGDKKYNRIRTDTKQPLTLVGLADMIELDSPWRRSLKALQVIADPDAGTIASGQEDKKRLIWIVDCSVSPLAISPRIQKGTMTGGWSKGGPCALSSLHAYAGRKMYFLSDQDRRICSAIRREYISIRRVDYSFDIDKALPAMIGHPFLFIKEGSVLAPIEFVKGEPELLVKENGDFFDIRFSGAVAVEGVNVVRETPSRYRIIEITDRHRQVARIIGSRGLQVPLTNVDDVVAVIGSLSSLMTVHSSIAADAASSCGLNFEEVPAETKICLHLMPFGTGLKLKMFVRPFGTEGPLLKPGQGVENVMVEVNGRRLQVRRDLRTEEENGRLVESACPTLARLDEIDREWHLQEEECLQVLLELADIRDRVRLEWPEGERLSVVTSVSHEHLRLKVCKKRNWFEVSGQLEVDEGQVLEMKKFIDLARKATGRFIPLGDGRFLALTREFHKRVENLLAFLPEETDRLAVNRKTLEVHSLAAPALAEFLEDVDRVEYDKGWQVQLRLLGEVRDLQPEVPSTLRAELRDYQLEGYVWLARLAHLGVGACLADDMGLGKTIQALSVILARAKGGPTLVAAPTSVCMNWFAEAARFAPTLKVIVFGGKGRQKQVSRLKPFDVLVTSYTMLQQEAKLLETVNWQTIILDEAQAIKNISTKRSRAAMALNGGFKLLTTGTPIENHLGELWNLFHFINPGLLGSLESFNRSFAVPIERHQSHSAKRRLRRLIRPFILRRIKSEVLEELPPRTEIVLQVEMSKEERAFYEALRREALEKLSKTTLGQAYNVRILAEIMRLRRACCNPRLVVPDTDVVSSKLSLFGKLIDELLENRHKVLVFSQFVGHLSIIREFLSARGIDYRYLDGKMSVRNRKIQVDKFQAGEGDIFLISLRAGGLGLNLTAADYVIHMDPWWNPAVEDQASDRAHRIGQDLPVTIYRLVVRDTIEEKIVQLHQEKKDLANSLLEGSNLSAKISVAELLNLIREE